MLVALSQPHFGQYDWQAPDADQNERLRARTPRSTSRVAGNHPSVVFYSMSHNATGYAEDMNPDLIDGIHGRRGPWASEQRRAAPCGREAIVNRARPEPHRLPPLLGQPGLDAHRATSTRTSRPIQELSDWFEHWATEGVKPVFTCEYGAPFTWDWTMYRGWYKGKRAFGSAVGALGVLPRRVERAVPRRPGLPDQRAGEEEPALGGQAVPRRQALAPLGLPLPGRLARASTSSYPVIAHVHHRQLAGLPHLGRVGQLALGARPLLEAARRASTGAARSSRSIGRTCSGRASAPTTSSGAYERMDLAYRALRLGRRRRRRRPCCATTCRCWPTSPASRRPSPARTTTSCPARRSRSSSSSSTTPARP